VSAKSVAVPAYLSPQMKQVVEEIAKKERRSVSNLLEGWIMDRPEVMAKLNGAKP